MRSVLFIGGPIHGKIQILPDAKTEVESPTDEVDSEGETIMFTYQICNMLVDEKTTFSFGVERDISLKDVLTTLFSGYTPPT